jgi:hypothetical protein
MSIFLNRRLAAGTLAFVLLAAVGCSNSSDGTAPSADSSQSPLQLSEKKAVIRVFVGDDQISKLHALTKEVSYRTTAEKITAAFESLREKPEPPLVSLFTGITFLTIEWHDSGELTLNLSIAPEGRFGAGGEQLVVQALMETAFQFDEVVTLNILLDGKPVESLMGHVDLPHPIRKSS